MRLRIDVKKGIKLLDIRGNAYSPERKKHGTAEMQDGKVDYVECDLFSQVMIYKVPF